MRRAGWVSLIAVPAAALLAQFDGGSANLAPGALLVSKPKLEDPNFAHTVVVLVQYDERWRRCCPMSTPAAWFTAA